MWPGPRCSQIERVQVNKAQHKTNQAYNDLLKDAHATLDKMQNSGNQAIDGGRRTANNVAASGTQQHLIDAPGATEAVHTCALVHSPRLCCTCRQTVYQDSNPNP